MKTISRLAATTIIVHAGRVLLQSVGSDEWLPVESEVGDNDQPDEVVTAEIRKMTGLRVSLFHPHEDTFSEQLRRTPQPVFIQIEDNDETLGRVEFFYYASASTDKIDISGPQRAFKWFSPMEIEACKVPKTAKALCKGALKVAEA